MKYNKELTEKLIDFYVVQKLSVPEIAVALGAEMRKSDPSAQNPPDRSIIAKLSTLQMYQKKQYLTKRGEIPVRKAEYIEKIANKLGQDVETLESLEKVTKNVLIMLLGAIRGPEVDNVDTKGIDLSE